MRQLSSAALGLLLLATGCSHDSSASAQKASGGTTQSSSSEAQTFADLAALRPRDRTAEQDVQLATYLAQAGRTEESFAKLADAAVKGFADLERLRTEPRFESLRSDERWQQLEIFVDVNASRGALPDQTGEPPQTVTAQRPQPPSSPVNVPAPDWALPDETGRIVKLSDLRGKVVIMDFWATWCGPCKKSMPEIDRFTRTYAGDDLVVLSVNVWERNPDVALSWYKEQGYAMELLFGSRDLTTAYQVQGIPHLCLIDADGIIRYSQPGFHPQVLDMLRRYTTGAKG